MARGLKDSRGPATRDDTRLHTGHAQSASPVEPVANHARLDVSPHSEHLFGLNGIYKPLARNLGIVDEDMRLGDAGYTLLKTWQAEQGLDGFLPTDLRSGPGTALRETLRSAVQDAIAKGCTDRSGQWKGWPLIAKHLAPGKIGRLEAALIQQMLLDKSAGTRGEVFGLLESRSVASDSSETQVVRDVLMPNASADLHNRLAAITAFEVVCTQLECLLEWLRYLSSHAGARAITSAESVLFLRSEPRVPFCQRQSELPKTRWRRCQIRCQCSRSSVSLPRRSMGRGRRTNGLKRC